jgi:hypothetical protein
MRIVVASALLSLLAVATPARADAPAPLLRLTPPEGRFFDDPVAVSPDGTLVAEVVTDAATHASLQVSAVAGGAPLVLDGLPVAVTSLTFLGPKRVLVVSRREGGDQLMGQVIDVVDKTRLAPGKTRLGPADAIEVTDHKGKLLVTTYSRVEKKSVEHHLQFFAADTMRSVARRDLVETSEGLIRGRAGELRPLWWSRGHTHLAGQKLGEYDKARDVRRPSRFVELDVVDNQVLDEHEIEDVLAFTKVSLARKSGPPVGAYARLSDDHKEILLLEGLDEHALPLAREINLYEPASLRSQILDDKTLLVGLQVDPHNVVAVGRRGEDPDDFDLYSIDRASMHGKSAPSARRVLTLPGQGRPVGFTAAAGRLAILRKDKGYDRGGVAIEIYALP